MNSLPLRWKIALTGMLPWICLVSVLGFSLYRELTILAATDNPVYDTVLWKGVGGFIFSALLLGFIVIISKDICLSLKALSAPFHEHSTKMLKSAEMLLTSGSDLSSSSIQQAANLQQIVSSADQINAMVSKNAESAKRSTEVSQKSASAAVRGRETVGRMLSSIEEISESNSQVMLQMDDSNKKIAEIVKVIKEIGKKTEVINDIVFQTKLLSFNASVEAARAGEHGKGFAVVAEEVGNLASMSGNASNEISTMLTESIAKVEAILSETNVRVQELADLATSKVDQGKVTAQECSQSLNEIVENIELVNNLVKEISEASGEQALGVKEITSAMGQLEQVTQQNSVTLQKSTEFSKALQSDSKSLLSLTGKFANLLDVSKPTPRVVKTALPAPTAKPIETAARPSLRVVKTPTKTRVNTLQKPRHPSTSAKAPRLELNKKKKVSGEAPDRNDSRFEEI